MTLEEFRITCTLLATYGMWQYNVYVSFLATERSKYGAFFSVVWKRTLSIKIVRRWMKRLRWFGELYDNSYVSAVNRPITQIRLVGDLNEYKQWCRWQCVLAQVLLLLAKIVLFRNRFDAPDCFMHIQPFYCPTYQSEWYRTEQNKKPIREWSTLPKCL